MIRSLTLTAAVLALAVLGLAPVFAGPGHDKHDDHGHDKPKHEKHEGHTDDHARVGGPYLLSTDPVTGESLIEVKSPVILLHEGREFRFANQDNAKKFSEHPGKFIEAVDKQIIESQKAEYPLETCVTSGRELGSMGDPIDDVYGNRLVRFCCKGCDVGFKKDPAAGLAKIDAAVIEAQKADYPLETCVVSGDKLGGEMGEPIDHVAGTQLVRFCCKGCVKMFESNPAAYLSKISATAGEQGEHDGHDHGKHGHGDHHGDKKKHDDHAGHGGH